MNPAENIVPVIRLIPIARDGATAEAVPDLPEVAAKACASTASLYAKVGFEPPWIGYLALAGSEIVGTCAFPAAPANGRVEIAYFTFPSFERRGFGTAMASALLALARAAEPEIVIFAQTLPQRNTSTAILERLGFKHAGEVDHAEEGRVWEWQLQPEDGRHVINRTGSRD